MTRNPAWILRRLLLMSPGEILHRSVRAIERMADRRRTKRKSVVARLDDFTGEEFPAGSWYLDLDKQNEIRSNVRDRWGWDETKAREFLNHRFTFFSFEAEDFGPTISWNRDYLSGKEAPLDFGPTLDYRDPEKCGDIKYAWELNRHHHLVELAKAWYLTGDDAYAHEVTHQVDSWIDSSPYLYGINWASSLESAIRVINWCFCLSLLESGIGTVVKREFVKKWMASIHEHLMFISRNFSGYSSANNHLIGEASGLFVGAVSCRFAESRKWISKSRQILEREVSRQNWPDGVNKEQALAYQAFVFDFLLLAGQLGGRNSVHFSKEYWSRLEKMAEFIHAMMDEDGEVPRIGDDDDGYVVRLSHRPDFRQFRSLLATSAILFGRRDFEAKSFGIDEKTFWLLGLTKTATPEAARETGDGTTSFPHGGYTILSGGGARLVFDSGPLGYLSLAAHGHADALSIVLNYDGRPFLVDPGTYAYHT
ncbi:MAG: heparinase II/III family protein, partial [Bacteroidota bacterium]